MADSDVLGIFSLLLAAGGAAYLIRARLQHRKELEASPDSEYPPEMSGSNPRSLPPGLPMHGFASQAPASSPDSDTERRKDTMPPSLRDISSREEQRRGKEQRVDVAGISGPNKALLLNADGSAKATLLSAGDDVAVKPVEKTKDAPAGKVSGTVEKDSAKGDAKDGKVSSEKSVAAITEKKSGDKNAKAAKVDVASAVDEKKKPDAGATTATATATATATKKDGSPTGDGSRKAAPTPNPPPSGVESKPTQSKPAPETKPSAREIPDPKKPNPNPNTQRDLKPGSNPTAKAVAPPLPPPSTRNLVAAKQNSPPPAPVSSSKIVTSAAVPPAPPSSQPMSVLPSSTRTPASRVGKQTIVGTSKLSPEPEIPRIEVEEDEDVEPTKVGKVSPRAIQPLVEKSIFDEGADKDVTTDEKAKKLSIYAFAQTDPGRRRKQNEDSHVVIEKHGLYIVADGMGGHRGGQYASKLAVDTMGEAFELRNFAAAAHADIPLPASELARAIQMSNAAILEEAKKKPELKGMGTTICAVRFTKDAKRLYVGHVGDSRCYRIRNGVMKQMTTDHTMADYGVAGPEGAHLSRALGVWPTVPIDVIMATPELNDVYLLCSDGLTKMLTNETIATQLLHEEDPKAAVERLVFFANAHGGKDNITVILLRVVEPDWTAPVSKRQQSKPDT